MGHIKQGYKQTEVGIIPEDWEVKSLKEVAPLQRGFDLPNRDLQKGVFPVVYSNGILNYHDKFQAKAPGIVTGRSGTIGKVTFVEEDYWPHNTSLWVTDFKNNNPKFIYYLFLAIKLERFATGSGVPILNRNDVHEFHIALPTLPEQTVIAIALSETDALISSLEKFIAKKRNIKQGAIQKLLRPKEDWEVKKLGEIAKVKSGKRLPLCKSLTENQTSHPYIRILDMFNSGISIENIKYVPVDVFPFIKNYRIFKEDIYISVAGTLGLVGRIPDVLDGANLTENANKITDIKCNINYLLFILKSDLIQNKIDAERTLGAQPKLALTRIRNFEIPLPPPIEQTHIATILSDMDSEITSLQTKLAKYKNIKLGMMQNLLTGKIRLI